MSSMITALNENKVLDHFRETGALMEGHFLLTSGLHSSIYLQCALVLKDAWRAEILCRELARKITDSLGPDAVDLVVSPAVGGIVVGYEMGRRLGVPAIFAERVEGEFELRRGFKIPKHSRVLMAEDIVTTGKSSRECISCISANGGRTLAASCLIDRSNGSAELSVPLYTLAQIEAPAYEADKLPPELAAIPAVKPGSRSLR